MTTRRALPMQLVLVLLLLGAGAKAHLPLETRNISLDIRDNEELNPEDGYPEDADAGVRRYECPAGFFRLRKFCYYLSAGTAEWREAHFACTARNATLTALDRPGKEKILRKYLMGDQFRRLERWIGGIYNWRQKNWNWGVSGDVVTYKNFAEPKPIDDSDDYSMHCIVLDPAHQYKWSSRSCIQQKYFICEVPAGRIGKSRRRKNISDPLAPQNLRMRKHKDQEERKLERLQRQKKKLKLMRKKNWHYQDDNQIWVHGIKPGSRPPKGIHGKRARLNKGPRHGHKNSVDQDQVGKVVQAPERPGAFPNAVDLGNSLTIETIHPLDMEVHRPRLNDITHEEILLNIP